MNIRILKSPAAKYFSGILMVLLVNVLAVGTRYVLKVSQYLRKIPHKGPILNHEIYFCSGD